ncbi:hypothetical protein K457DRAFT_129959 [Linnemannia elongata AG-77]|uniref:Uncharacterized protein n=1 Tax=Linnemannia elongata AG-77 TaxID=1314771 RepID=A0A197JI54_9FUNG|nr:hypothetical protein K457DRAFT_129959 [Linnemannia elongata AG-77]
MYGNTEVHETCPAADLQEKELGGDGDGVAERFESWTTVRNKVGESDGETLGGIECDSKSGASCAKHHISEEKAKESEGDGKAAVDGGVGEAGGDAVRDLEGGGQALAKAGAFKTTATNTVKTI